MERMIGPAVSLLLSLVAIALAFGKLIIKTDRNMEDIEKVDNSCKQYRELCQGEISKKIDTIFTKLDTIRDMAHENITKLSVQIARLEEKMDRK